MNRNESTEILLECIKDVRRMREVIEFVYEQLESRKQQVA